MTYYTVTGKLDGFGAQYFSVMSGIAFCEAKGYTYIHTPFVSIEHDVNVEELNMFVGIKNQINDTSTLSLTRKMYPEDVLFSPRPSLYFTPPVIEKLRTFYYSTPKPEITPVDIAIHIRRGDVSKSAHNDRYNDNSVYVKLINTLKMQYPSYTINVFSEGKLADFKDLQLEDAQFRLNEDIKTTFHSFVTAKVLVTSKSCLSYAAAILNPNTIYYISFWHRPLDHWQTI